MTIKNENRSGYKKTKVGWIPDEWEKVAIGELGDVVTGSTPSTKNESYYGGNNQFVSPADMSDRKYIYSTIKTITSSGLKTGRVIPKNSVMVTCIASLGKIGMASDICITNQQINSVICKSNVNPHYVYYYLNANQRELISLAATTAVPIVNKTQFSRIKIILPPLPEQEKIAEVLSCWDEGIEKLDKLILAKQRNKKALMQKLLTGKKRFKEFENKEWSETIFGSLFEEITRKVGEKDLTPFSISAGIGFVSQREKWGKNISGAQHNKYTHLKAGEFAYNKGNSKRYKQGCTYLPKKGEICVPNVFISFKAKCTKVVSEFYEQFFVADYHARELKRYITSGARSDGLLNLSKKDFFKIKVPCPTLPEQKKIASVLKSCDTEIDLLKEKLAKFKSQKKGLMQKLLTGEIRVKV